MCWAGLSLLGRGVRIEAKRVYGERRERERDALSTAKFREFVETSTCNGASATLLKACLLQTLVWW